MEFIRTKCLSPRCPAMACPSQTGYCSYHDLQRTRWDRAGVSTLLHVTEGLPICSTQTDQSDVAVMDNPSFILPHCDDPSLKTIRSTFRAFSRTIGTSY